MATKIIENSALAKIYDNATKSLSASDASALAQKSNESYVALKTEMSNVISRLDINTWDDAISAEINNSTKTGLETLIDACKSPADEIMIQTGNNIAKYNDGFVNYRNKVKEHNDLVPAVNDAENELGNEPNDKEYKHTLPNGKTEKRKTPEYAAYLERLSNLNDLQGKLSKLASEVTTWEKYCSSIVENIKGVLSPIESQASSAALSASFGTPSNYSKESAEKYGYGNEYYVNGTRVVDPNGKLVSETYEVVGPDGKIVETGEVYYDGNGVPTTEIYHKKPPEPTTVSEIEEAKVEYEKEGIPPELVYVDENVTPAEETSTQTTEYTLGEGENPGKFTNEEHRERTFNDGTEVISDIKTEGIVEEVVSAEGTEEKKLIPTTTVEDSKIITEEQGTFDYHSETVYENGMKDYAAAQLSQDGQVLAQIDTDYVGEYNDQLTGYNVDVQNKVVETQKTTTTISSVVYKTDDNGTAYAEEVTVTRNNDDPSCGSVMYSNGEGYTVERNESGQLEVTEYYPDKNGEIQTSTQTINDAPTAQLSVTNHETGQTEVTSINTENPLDQFIVSNSYQTARIDSGYNASAAMEGSHHLWLGNGNSMDIQPPLSTEPSYTMSLTMLND